MTGSFNAGDLLGGGPGRFVLAVCMLAAVALPIAGLMTPEPVEQVGPRVDAYNEHAAALGILPGTRSPILSLSGIALPVIHTPGHDPRGSSPTGGAGARVR